MTDPVDLPPAPPGPPPSFAAPPAAQAEPWQRRLEVLALLLVVSVVVLLIAAFAGANAQLSISFDAFPGSEQPSKDLTEIIRIAGSSANIAMAGALLVALLLVTLGPGDRIGRQGTTVLWGLVGVGLITAGLGAVSAVLTVTGDVGPMSAASLQTGMVGEDLVGKLSGVAPLLIAAVIAGYVAWCAFSTLGDVPPDPVAPDDLDDLDGPGDLGTAADGAWAPPPAPLP